MSYYTVNSVLERLFSGQFSLNVRTATIGQVQGRTSVEHDTWPQPQPQPVLPYHGGTYVHYTICMLLLSSCYNYGSLWICIELQRTSPSEHAGSPEPTLSIAGSNKGNT